MQQRSKFYRCTTSISISRTNFTVREASHATAIKLVIILQRWDCSWTFRPFHCCYVAGLRAVAVIGPLSPWWRSLRVYCGLYLHLRTEQRIEAHKILLHSSCSVSTSIRFNSVTLEVIFRLTTRYFIAFMTVLLFLTSEDVDMGHGCEWKSSHSKRLCDVFTRAESV